MLAKSLAMEWADQGILVSYLSSFAGSSSGTTDQ